MRQYTYTLFWPSGRSTGITYSDPQMAYLAARDMGATVRRQLSKEWREERPFRALMAS